MTDCPTGASDARRPAETPRPTRTAPSERDRRATGRLGRGDDTGEVRERCDRREGPKRDLDRVVGAGRRRPPRRREERNPFRAGPLVEPVERPPLAQALPGADHLDALNEQPPVAGDPDGRAPGMRRAPHHARLHEHPAREALVRGEEIRVDAADGRSGDPPLHRGDGLPAEHRFVREHRLERIEPAGSRRGHHVDDLRAVRREHQLALVGDAGRQGHGGSGRRRRESACKERD